MSNVEKVSGPSSGCLFLPILCVPSTQALAVLAWVDYITSCHSITDVWLTLPA